MNQPTIFVKTDSQVKKLNLSEIYFVKADDNYVNFVAIEYREMVRTSLETALSQLPTGLFAQINRSTAVAIDKIDSIEKDILRLTTDPIIELTIGKKYQQTLLTQLRIIGINITDSENEDANEDGKLSPDL